MAPLAQSPLNINVPIVSPEGKPTLEFARKWADQVRLNSQSAPITTLAQMSAALDLIASTPDTFLYRSATLWAGLTTPNDSKRFLNGANPPAFQQVKESDLSFTDNTTSNVTSGAHGFAPKSPGAATQFLNGAATPAFAQVQETDLAFTDVTGNNVSTIKHGFVPKAPGLATQYLDGSGGWSTPAGGGGGGGGGGGALTRIARTVLASDGTFSFTGIPATYDHLQLIVNSRSPTTTTKIQMQFNGDVGTNYLTDQENRFGATGTSGAYALIGEAAPSSLPTKYASVVETLIPDYAATSFFKGFLSLNNIPQSASPYAYEQNFTGLWKSTAAINSITLATLGGGNFLAGSSATLYGVGAGGGSSGAQIVSLDGYSIPTAAEFSVVLDMPGAAGSVVNTTTGLVLTSTSATEAARIIRAKLVPASFRSVVFQQYYASGAATSAYGSSTLVFYSTTGANFCTIGLGTQAGTTAFTARSASFNKTTGVYAGNLTAGPSIPNGAFIRVSINNAATTLYVFWSVDGVAWVYAYSLAIATYIGGAITHIGVSANNTDAVTYKLYLDADIHP